MVQILENIKLYPKANVYFEGKVISYNFSLNNKKYTLGIIFPGTYIFDVNDKEIVEIVTGEVEIKTVDNDEWLCIKVSESFVVPENTSYEIRCNEISEYICEYIS